MRTPQKVFLFQGVWGGCTVFCLLFFFCPAIHFCFLSIISDYAYFFLLFFSFCATVLLISESIAEAFKAVRLWFVFPGFPFRVIDLISMLR